MSTGPNGAPPGAVAKLCASTARGTGTTLPSASTAAKEKPQMRSSTPKRPWALTYLAAVASGTTA